VTQERLEHILAGFPEAAVAVVGDFFLDKYLVLEAALTEVSLETGLDAYQVVERRCSPGAAGTVTNNLTALEVGRVCAIGFTGDDGEGYELRQGLARTGVDTSGLLRRSDLFTPTYTKPMMRDAAGAETELSRLDTKNRRPTPRDLEDAVIEHVEAALASVGVVILADQVAETNLGVITDRVRDAVCAMARRRPDVVFLADSREHIGFFRDVMVKPNKFEAAKACGFAGREEDLAAAEAERHAADLAARNGRPVFLTVGRGGIILLDQGSRTPVAGVPVPPPVDIVGAGDSATAGIVASLCAGASAPEAAAVGNCVASLTIQQLGTTGTTSRAEVARRFADNQGLFDAL
jgi:rfaE bifunctional protein kinase chain/domain